jgi:hypothetical protein
MSQANIGSDRNFNRTPMMKPSMLGFPKIQRSNKSILQSFNGGSDGGMLSVNTVGLQGNKSLALKKNFGLRGNAPNIVNTETRKSLPAGIPSSFVSNVTARNQFTKVQTKLPIDMTDETRRKGSVGSSGSPYQKMGNGD